MSYFLSHIFMNNSSRIYGFDALRAIAMWLGVLLHTIIFFKQSPEPNWPHDDRLFSSSLEFLYQLIHSFRMPVFFLVAGYFGGLVCEKKGLRVFLRQRAGRIVIPFIVSLIFLVPLTLLPFHYFRFRYDEQFTVNESIIASVGQMMKWNGFAHLWFLYYLIGFSLISVFLVRLSRNVKISLIRSTGKPTPFLLLLFSFVLLYAIRYSFSYQQIPTYTGVKIVPGLFLLYSFFYFSGWILYFSRFNFTSLLPFGVPLLIIAAVCSAILFGIQPTHVYPPFLYGLITLQCLSIIYGSIAVFIGHFNRDNAFWRYFSDSSYWVYLLHLGVAAGTQVLLHPLLINPWVKLVIIFGVTFIVCVGTYHFWVSNSFIGKALNGKKIKRSGVSLSFLSIRKQKPQRSVPDQ